MKLEYLTIIKPKQDIITVFLHACKSFDKMTWRAKTTLFLSVITLKKFHRILLT